MRVSLNRMDLICENLDCALTDLVEITPNSEPRVKNRTAPQKGWPALAVYDIVNKYNKYIKQGAIKMWKFPLVFLTACAILLPDVK